MSINRTTPEFIQNVVDLAVGFDRSVSFICPENNDWLRQTLENIDTKGCRFLKKTRDDNMVTVWPEEMGNFIFE